MSNVTVELNPNEFDRVLIALQWYIHDRKEAATDRERGIFDAGAAESQTAAAEASNLLTKLRQLLS